MERWWEPRRKGELTTEFLARVLAELPVGDMARRAREGHFAPVEVADGMEMLRLVAELDDYASRPSTSRNDRARIRAVVAAVKEGEFDGTKEESDRWSASADGQATFRQLVEGR